MTIIDNHEGKGSVRMVVKLTALALLAAAITVPSAASAGEVEAKAMLKAMTDYMAAQKDLAFRYDASLEVMTKDGEKLQIAYSGRVTLARPDRIAASRSGGFADIETIFDGKTLKGWDGTADVWHVEDGNLVGVSSPEHPSGTTNIIWRGGQPANFALKVEMKLEGTGANGGIQYRSQMLPLNQKYGQWNMRGYQADFDYANKYTGQLYEQSSPRGIVAWRGNSRRAPTRVRSSAEW